MSAPSAYPKRVLRHARTEVARALSRVPLVPASRVRAAAARYWTTERGDEFKGHSHWREASAYDDATWWSIGAQHLELFRQMVGHTTFAWETIVDWGAGGGANGVHFAPYSKEYVAADLSQATLDECRRQVASVAGARIRTVLVDLGDPELSVVGMAGTADLFICLYVLELVPTREDALRIMRLAHALLRSGGMAFVQVKYQTKDWRTRSRHSRFQRELANMTTFRVEEFWSEMLDIGFSVRSAHLVPKNELDERYAYYLLVKP